MLSVRRGIPLLLFVVLQASTLPSQVPAAAKPDPAVTEKIAQFKKLILDRKGDQVKNDQAAIKIIDELLSNYEGMHPKDKKDFAKALGEPLKSRKVKRESTKAMLYRAAITALGRTGTNGSPHLMAAFKNKSKYKDKEWMGLKAEMLTQLGKTKDEKKAAPFLLDEALKNIHDPLMAAAGGALQFFEESNLKLRQSLCKKLIRKFDNIYGNANLNLDPGDLQVKTWKQRLAAVSDPWNTTLQKLTKRHFRSPPKWMHFYNKNKNKNWDKPPKKTKR